MEKFYKVFGTRPIVLPVIHVISERQALENVRIAREAGSDGVFLINHRIPNAFLLLIYCQAVSEFPDFWVGVNCLDLSAGMAFREIARRGLHMAGLWVDDPLIDERRIEQPGADLINELRRQENWDGLYFGGIAFKYQRSVLELEKAAHLAAGYMDVITTSGPGTGLAAEVEKIRRMKTAIGEKPLAIASGITAENVADYLPFADCFMVATGISKDFSNLDQEKMKKLLDRVREGS